MKYIITILLTAYAIQLSAQRDWDAVVIKTYPITENISYLEGSGGNIGVLYGDDGILIVDDQYAELSDKISQALSELSDGAELKYIVSTHYHGDHTGGNENLSKNAALIVGHHNTRERLGTTFYSELWERDVESKPESFWPVITFSDELTIHFNDEKINITHLPNAHTDGDVLIHFKTSNVLHTGDLFVRYGFPFIDVPAGGSIDGMIRAQEKILEISDKNTRIIPGHGSMAGIEDVQELLDMLRATRNIVAEMKRSGKSLDDCISSNPLSKFHERWNGSFITTDLFVRLVFESVK